MFFHYLTTTIMKSRQSSKLKMYFTVRIFLLSNPDILAKLPNLNEFLAQLDAAIVQIQNSSEQNQYSTKGITVRKQQFRKILAMLTVDASAKMQAYARYTHNTVLLAETKFTKTGLRNISALNLIDIANGLYNRIQENIDKVGEYYLTAETQPTYKGAIDDYSKYITKTRQSQLESKKNTLLETEAFATADEALSNIKTLVKIVELTEPGFYTGFKNACKIVKQGTGSLQVQGIITEASTKKPIPGAELTFCLSGQTDVVIKKRTAAKGRFMIKSLAEGIYDLTITKTGFKDKIISVVVRWDELCNVVEELEEL